MRTLRDTIGIKLGRCVLFLFVFVKNKISKLVALRGDITYLNKIKSLNNVFGNQKITQYYIMN